MNTRSDAVRQTLRLADLGELVETVPYLLGFHPEASVVQLGLDKRCVVVTARLDLGDAGRQWSRDHAADVALRAGATTAILVVFAAGDDPDVRGADVIGDLPHTDLVNRWITSLDRRGLRLVEAVFVQAGYWWSYAGRAQGCQCCRSGNKLPGDSAVAPAEAVFAGLQARPNRDALRAVIEPGSLASRQRYLPAIAAVQTAFARADTEGRRLQEQRSIKRAIFASAREADGTLFSQTADAQHRLTTPQLCRFAVGLSDIAIRDALWVAIDQQRLDGRALWLQLLQRLPPPYDSPAVFLFGWATWRDGNATLAAMAAEQALRSDPGYRAADLLMSTVESGLDPYRTPRLRLPARRR